MVEKKSWQRRLKRDFGVGSNRNLVPERAPSDTVIDKTRFGRQRLVACTVAVAEGGLAQKKSVFNAQPPTPLSIVRNETG